MVVESARALRKVCGAALHVVQGLSNTWPTGRFWHVLSLHYYTSVVVASVTRRGAATTQLMCY